MNTRIAIPEAAAIQVAAIRQEAIDDCMGYIVKAIARAAENGHRNTAFTPTAYWYTDAQGQRRCLHVEDDLKQILKRKGYWFKPTGYIGGVWQRTEEICW